MTNPVNAFSNQKKIFKKFIRYIIDRRYMSSANKCKQTNNLPIQNAKSNKVSWIASINVSSANISINRQMFYIHIYLYINAVSSLRFCWTYKTIRALDTTKSKETNEYSFAHNTTAKWSHSLWSFIDYSTLWW